MNNFYYLIEESPAARLGKLDGNLNLTLVKEYNDWHKFWDMIISGKFLPPGSSDGLLLYDRRAGKASIVKINSEGSLTQIHTADNLSRTWFNIVSTNPGGISGLLLYDNTWRLRIHAIRCADDDGTRRLKYLRAEVKQCVDAANDVYHAAGIHLDFDPESRLGKH